MDQRANSVEDFYVACPSAETAIWTDTHLRFNPEGHHARLELTRDELLVMRMVMATRHGHSLLRKVAQGGCIVGQRLERARRVVSSTT